MSEQLPPSQPLPGEQPQPEEPRPLEGWEGAPGAPPVPEGPILQPAEAPQPVEAPEEEKKPFVPEGFWHGPKGDIAVQIIGYNEWDNDRREHIKVKTGDGHETYVPVDELIGLGQPVKVERSDGTVDEGWKVAGISTETGNIKLKVQKPADDGSGELLTKDVLSHELWSLQFKTVPVAGTNPSEAQTEVIKPPEQHPKEEEAEELPELPESKTLESLHDSIAKSESKITTLESQLDETKSRIKEATDANHFDKVIKLTERAKKTQTSLKAAKSHLKSAQRRLKSSEEMLSPANILDLKDKFDQQLSKEKDRRRRLQDDEPIDSYADMLMDQLIAKYAQTGMPEGKTRNVSKALSEEIKALMNFKQADLEAHLSKATPTGAAPKPDATPAAPKTPDQPAGVKDLLPPGFDLPENLRQQVQDRYDSPELKPYTDPEDLIYPGLVLINPSDPDRRRLVLALYTNQKGTPIPVVNIEGEPGLRNSSLDELRQKIKSGELVPEADYRKGHENAGKIQTVDQLASELRKPQVAADLKRRFMDRMAELQPDPPQGKELDEYKMLFIEEYLLSGRYPNVLVAGLPDDVFDTLRSTMDLSDDELDALRANNQRVDMAQGAGEPGKGKGAEQTEEEKSLELLNTLKKPGVAIALKQRAKDKLESLVSAGGNQPEGKELEDFKRMVVEEYLNSLVFIDRPALDKLLNNPKHNLIITLMTAMDLSNEELETMFEHKQRVREVGGDYFPPAGSGEIPPGVFDGAKAAGAVGIGAWIRRRGLNLKNSGQALIETIKDESIPADDDRSDEANRRRRRLFAAAAAGAVILALAFPGDTEKDLNPAPSSNANNPAAVANSNQGQGEGHLNQAVETWNNVEGRRYTQSILPSNLEQVPISDDSGPELIRDKDTGVVIVQHVTYDSNGAYSGRYTDSTLEELHKAGYNTGVIENPIADNGSGRFTTVVTKAS